MEKRRFAIAGMLFALATVWARAEPPSLAGIDAGCYARIASETAQWHTPTWGGEPFYEHPPLAIWLERIAFSIGGEDARTAVTLARVAASIVVLAVVAVAFPLAGDRVAGLSAVALTTFGGFFYDSQNPMLEIFLTAAMGVGLAFRRSIFFGLSFAAAFFIKGPPALAMLVFVRRWRAAVSALVVLLIAVVAFEAARSEPFFATYFQRQVMKSLIEGRHHTEASPFFYARPLALYYGPMLAALPVALWLRRRDPLLWMAILWVLAIVGGFSVAKQKYEWYIQPAMLGAAWIVAVGADALLRYVPERFVTRLPPLLLGAAALWVVVMPWLPLPMSTLHRSSWAVEQLKPKSRLIADCSVLGVWRAGHLFAFYWHAERRACDDASAGEVFDGETLTTRSGS